jgi:hypothetical protein
MTETKIRVPHGVGAFLTSSDGDVVAYHFDFDRSGMGGCHLWEAQMYRAKRFVKWDYLKNYTYGDVFAGMNDYICEQIVDRLLRDKKLKMTIVPIGHDVDISELNR